MLALALARLAPDARADGDPASDVLAQQAVYLPADAGISSAQQQQLGELVAAAARGGYPLRVALIASPADLGSVSALWRAPQSYAQFLGQELSLSYLGRLLVVMPNGFGIYHDGRPVSRERAALGPPSQRAQGAVGLGAATLVAIRRLAAKAGVALPAASGSSAVAGGSGHPVSWLVFALGGVIVAAAWIASLRARPLRLRRT